MRSFVARARLAALIAVAGWLVTSCTDGITNVRRVSAAALGASDQLLPGLYRVTVTLDSTTLAVSHATQAHAKVEDILGRDTDAQSIAWSSSNPSVADVTRSGLVTAYGIGTVTITATTGGSSGSATLRVVPGPAASITVTIDSAQISVPHQAKATAIVRDSSGNVLADRVTWSSSDSTVASVDQNGTITAQGIGGAAITASTGTVSGSKSIVVTGETEAVASIRVSLSASSVATGATPRASATLYDSNGNVVPGGSVTWSSSNTAVATVDSTGLEKAAAPGSANIIATSQGKTGSATLTVTGSGGDTGVAPAVVEDFSTYKSTQDLLANPRGIWVTSEAVNTDHITLDETLGYGTSNQSMRYDWPNNGAKCLDYAIKPGMLRIPGNVTHVWVEFVVRFKTNFTVTAGASGCASEYKLASMGDLEHGIGRWNIPEMQASQFVVGYPGNDAGYSAQSPVPSTLWDGKPHVFRVEAALGIGAPTGVLRWWVDGKLIINQTGFTTAASHQVIDVFGPGLNINQGPGEDGMEMWWHRIAVYTTNPNWW